MTRQRIVVGLLLIAAGVQTWQVIGNYAVQWAKAAWRTRDMPAEQRSALFMLGRGGMEYMWFLRSTVPTDQAVVLAYRAVEFSDQSIMQFFLMPRGIPGCPCEGPAIGEMSGECIQCLLNEDHYVPAIGEFPPDEVISPPKQLIAFADEDGWFRGVYAPASGLALGSNPAPPESSSRILVAGADVLVYAGIFVLGSFLIGLAIREPAWGELFALSLPLGLGSLTLAVFLAGWSGIPVTAATFGMAFTLLLAIAAGARRIAWGEALPFPPIHLTRTSLGDPRRQPAGFLALSGLVLIGGLAVLVSLTRGYSTHDGIVNWAVKGYAIAHENSIFAGAGFGRHGLAYPQNIPLSIAMFRLFDQDALPGSKLLFPLLTWSMVWGCIYSWRRGGVELTVASLGGLVLVTMPVIFYYATLDFANLPFTSYVVLGVLWLVKGLSGERNGELMLGGALLGFGSWTRPEGSGFGLMMLVGLSAAAWLTHRVSFLRLSTVLPYVVPTGIWLAFGTRYMASDEIGVLTRAFRMDLLAGELRLAPLIETLRYAADRILSPADWRLVTVLIGSLLLIGILARQRPSFRFLSVASFAALIALLIPIVMFTVALHSGDGYGRDFLDGSFDRAIFPGIALLFWTAVATSAGGRKGDKTAA